MENKKSNSSLKAIIIVLSILLVGSLAFMYKMSTDNKEVETELEKTISTKTELETELKEKIASYDAAIADNTSIKGELEAEKAKVVDLLSQVQKSKDDNKAALKQFKEDYRRLKSTHDALIAENSTLKEENAKLTTQRDSTQNALNESKKYNDTLVNQNDNLSKTVEKAQKLAILNLQTQPYKERSSGKLIQTDKARRVDKIRITFTIAANEVAPAGNRTYYVQIIDPKNNVIGEKATETFGDFSLTYSFITNAIFENKTITVNELVSGKDFAKGLYAVNIFDKGQLVANTTFTLK
jgi:myosin heavy subunit